MSIPLGTPCSAKDCCEMSIARNLCARHYKRWQRYGDVAVVKRPSDWGSRENHPLYGTWAWLKRAHLDDVCTEWKNDFWVFVYDVVERPANARLVRRDRLVKYGPNNTSWRPFEKSVDQRIESAKYQRNWRAKNARSVRSNTLKSHYGIDIDVYESMLDLQDHKCAICGKQEGSIQANGKPFSLAVDHCHESKKIRGLLCSNCNRGLGIFGDNIATLLRAIEYLKQ